VANVVGGLIAYPRDKAPEVLRGYREIMAKAPDELTAYAALLWGPDGTPLTAIVPCWIGGDEATGRQAIKPLTEIAEPLVVDLHHMPLPAMQSMLDGAYGPGSRNYWKSTYLTGLTDEAIDTIFAQSKGMTIPGSAILIEHCSGATRHRKPGENAFGQRGWDYLAAVMPLWTNPADDAAQTAWAKSATDALKPYSAGGTYLNYIGADEDATVKASFGSSFERLRDLKRKYDPKNFFSLNANVAP